MMRKIFKYEVLNLGTLTLRLSAGSKVVSFGFDCNRKLCLWATVPETELTVERHFLCAFTGEEVPDDAIHLGTAVSQYVWHLFEVSSP